MTIPLAVRLPDGLEQVEVRALRSADWGSVRPQLCAALGLDPGTEFFHGPEPVTADMQLGMPPLLHGAVLALAAEAAATPADTAPVHLVVIAGPAAGRTIAVRNETITVGRHAHCTFRLSDPALSRHHFSIRPTADGVLIADPGSTNGVSIDGMTVTAPAAANLGAIIRAGNSVLRLEAAAPARPVFAADGAGHLRRVTSTVRQPVTPPSIPPPPAPPDPPPRRTIPILATVMSALLGVGLAVVLRNPMYLAFAAFGPLMMLGSVVADRMRGRKSQRSQQVRYRRQLRRWVTHCATATAIYRRDVWRYWLGPLEVLRSVDRRDALLWDRSRTSPDYLRVAVGVGRMPVPVSGARRGTDSAVLPAAAIESIPITISLPSALGFVGDDGRATLRYLLAQVLCAHPPADVALVMMSRHTDMQSCGDTPHAVPATGSVDDVLDRIGDRDVLLVCDAVPAEPQRQSEFLARCGADSGRDAGHLDRATWRSFVIADRRSDLPAAVSPLPRDGLDAHSVMTVSMFQRVCRGLAPLRDRPSGVAADLPRRVTLAEIMPTPQVEELREHWRTPRFAAVVGAAPAGVATVDLDQDGPHVLIAGTTGSGKSELLQTMIASLALAASPTAINFLLVDYKGGAAFAAIETLPHVVGMLTDLDAEMSARALASLRAELRRREHLAAGTAERPPKLMVVIDEFATLAAELPEFLAGLLDVAQRGRSLGLHLVLATQRPAGVVSPAIRANISARICLRVTDSAESIDVIGTAQAAQISRSTPGRAAMRTSEGVRSFQTALLTCEAPPPLQIHMARRPRRAETDHRVRAADGAAPAAQTAHQLTIASEVVSVARAAASGLPAPHRPWVEPLPALIPADGDTGFAMADCPDLQRHDRWSAPTESVLVVGPPKSGRSSALRRLAAAAASVGAEIVVVDMTGGLADLTGWPQVSTYLTEQDPRLILRALTVLAEPEQQSVQRRRLLLVDGYDLAIEELERTHFAAGSNAFITASARCGNTLQIAACGPGRLARHRSASIFSEVIEFASSQQPGRARWRERTVQVIDGTSVEAPLTRATWPDRLIVRPLPTEVSTSQLPQPVPQRVPIGLGGDDASPVFLDLETAHGAFLVTGARRSGVTTAVTTVAEQAARAGIPTIHAHLTAAAAAAAQRGARGIEQFSHHVDCSSDAHALRAALAAHDGPLVVACDPGRLGADHPAAALLERFLEVCDPGQVLIAGVDQDVVQRARRTYIGQAAAAGHGILLSPAPLLADAWGIAVPRRSGRPPPGRGWMVTAGVATPLHLARTSVM